jgi:pterin-4a-carbinolamine dehydratase
VRGGALCQAIFLLVIVARIPATLLIGEHWLTSHDQYGRRRLDFPDDWVRLEVSLAIKKKKKIYPVIIGPKLLELPKEALPDDMSDLCGHQYATLRRDGWKAWMADMRDFAYSLENDGVASFADKAIDPPPKSLEKMKLQPLTEKELAKKLTSLEQWEPWADCVVSEYPRERQELLRTITFPTFEDAIKFMVEAARLFRREDHHPRWSNEWKTVTIRLSTWDVGNKITKKDIQVAEKVDGLVRSFFNRQEKRLGKVTRASTETSTPRPKRPRRRT